MENSTDSPAAESAPGLGSLADQANGRELDKLIAEHVFGWSEINHAHWGTERPGMYGQKVPHYSSNLSHAGLVLEQMQEASARWFYELHSAPDRVRHRAKFVETEYENHASGGIAYGATPAEAICRAALKAIARQRENIALAGFNYYMFLPRKCGEPPAFKANTRIYSTILIDNALPLRWRGRYNEDTDLSLRVLKSGLCTVQFNAFLSEKMRTMKMKGGNTDELYQGDGRLKMAQSLQEQHPDVTKITRKWNRWQHHVDYRPFAGNALTLRPGVEVPAGIDNFGMAIGPA